MCQALSLAPYLTLRDAHGLQYRLTVYYAHHPCDQAMDSLDLLAAGHRRQIVAERVLKDEIVAGIDELGVLLLSEHLSSLWLGSQWSIDRARSIAPHNNATSLQVVGSMMAAIAWIERNPHAGRGARRWTPDEFVTFQAAQPDRSGHSLSH